MNNDEKDIDLPIDAASKSEVIAQTLKHLSASYVFPEVASAMALAINKRLACGDYDAINSSLRFAETLTLHLREISNDKHLTVFFNSQKVPLDKQNKRTPEELQRISAERRSKNYGFRKAEILPGNVGYIVIDGFWGIDSAFGTAAATMAFVANTDALILDIRRNRGCDPAMVAFLSSYFFEKRVHLNDIFYRPTNKTTSWWTHKRVPGRRYLDKEIYILTSNYTFSAPEEFAYNLKNLKRATIVGEKTGGGAHPGGRKRVNDYFGVWMPNSRSINPITKTNWEGVGVTPDIMTKAEEALEVAYQAALKNISEKNSVPKKAEVP